MSTRHTNKTQMTASMYAYLFESDYITACRQEHKDYHITPGDKFGHATIIADGEFLSISDWDENGDATSVDLFEARCDCGARFIADGDGLRAGKIQCCDNCKTRMSLKQSARTALVAA